MLALLLTACIERIEVREDEKAEVVREHMSEHWTDAVAIRDRVLFGQPVAAKKAAVLFQKRLPLGDLGDLDQTALLAGVQAVVDARTLEQSAQGLGQMTQACSDCHRQVGPAVDFTVPLSPDAPGLAAEMARHKRASDLIWRGLVANYETDLDLAVETLNTAPLSPSGTHADSKLPPAATDLEVRVHDLAAKVRRKAPEQRGHVYGELIGTCATCHQAYRR